MSEKIWLPDLLLTAGRLEPGLALVADESGKIIRLSRAPNDLAAAERLSGRAMLPGFVNAHSHSFQRAIRGRTEYRTEAAKDTFWTWREAMYHAAQRLTPEGIYATARMCFLEMALAGITTVGEFHYLHRKPNGDGYSDPTLLAQAVVRAAREVGIRIALLQTGYARAGWKQDPNPGQTRFLYRQVEEFLEAVEQLERTLTRQHGPDAVWVGVAPHSLRAVTLADFRLINSFAKTRQMPVHMHVSEQRGENQSCRDETGATPIALLEQQGQLHAGFTAIHAVHVTEQEIGALALAQASVCACPTTERNLGDGLVAADKLRAAGVNLALGTDSQIQIDPLEDARQLEYHLRLQREERMVLDAGGDALRGPDCLARHLLSCATAGGARALGSKAGQLDVGRPADFFTVDLQDPSVAGCGQALAPLVFGLERTAIRDVVVGGKRIVQSGKHADQMAIVAAFEGVQRELWHER